MSIQAHIEIMKEIEDEILNFIDREDNTEEYFQNIISKISDLNINTDRYNLKTLLHLLSNILNNHHRSSSFIEKISKIFMLIQHQTKTHFTNYEIYKIFEKNPRFLLFLITEKVIEIDENILKIMPKRYLIYLLVETAQKEKLIDSIPENFQLNQEIGENEDIVSQMIRKDLIDEFITYVNRQEYSLNSQISNSIFETNYFLIQHQDTSLIEYAAFFGSTQIFKYLYKNEAELTSSLWLYAIHSDNPEIINLLEENHVQPPNNSYDECIKESIKCHHNDVTNYIQSNLIDEDIQNININIYSYSFHYYNFTYFPQELNNEIFFNYACKYDYFKIVEYFIKTIKIDIKENII